MATIRGQDGTLTFGGSTPAEITQFNLKIANEMIESKSKGTPWTGKKPGHKNWSGTVTFNLDNGDTAQSALNTAMLATSMADPFPQKVVCVFKMDGVTSGARAYYGSGYLADIELVSPEGSSTATFTANIEGDGAISNTAPT
jgi:hypothetical protein